MPGELRLEKGTEKALMEIIRDLERGVTGVKGVALADSKGLPVASFFKVKFDLLTVAAMSALVAQSAKGVFRNMGLKGPKLIILEGEEELLVVHSLGSGAISFVVVVQADANLGLLKMEMFQAGERIEQVLGMARPPRAVIHDIFVLANSGLLIRHYSRDLRPEIDSDIMGGMLVAIQEFVRDALRSREGNLDELQFGKYRIHLTRGKYTIVAAVLTGEGVGEALKPVLEALEDFEDRHAAVLGKWDGSLDHFLDIDQIFETVMQQTGHAG